jgi:ectoine hydroxylase-related dioxygenase (phytanoyl-CoA dioxygenase family)
VWLESVEESGFAVIPQMLSLHDVARLLDNLSQGALRRSKAGVRHALKHDAVAAVARDPRVLGIAEEILGRDAFPFRATLFDKSPNANWLVVWHQDTALPLRERREVPGWGPWSVKEGVTYAHAPASALCKVVALRIHLDDSTPENGPLRVLPRTHTLGVLTDNAIHHLAAEGSATDCLVPAGGVLVMRPLLVHSSSKLRREISRRVLHIEYAATPILADGLELAVV